MTNKKVVIFLIFTFSLTWLPWWSLAFLKHDHSQIYSSPMFFILFAIGGLAPTIASYISIIFSDRNYRGFNKEVWKWRINISYYLFCIVSVFGVRYLSIAFYGLIFKPIWAEITPQFLSLFPLIFLMILFGGLEEFGWRGLLLPELNKKFNLSISALIVGLNCPSNGQYITAIIWLIYGGGLLLYQYLTNSDKIRIKGSNNKTNPPAHWPGS